MVIVTNDGKIMVKGQMINVLAQLGAAVDEVFDNPQLDEKSKFYLMIPMIFGGDRIDKLNENKVLDHHIHVMLDEVWKAVELIEKYIDSYSLDSEPNQQEVD